MGYLFIVIYAIIILAVIEINVIFFTLTGLEKHISRFQVISMLTGTGFTTGESELIIAHPVRRKLSAFLILFGAFSLAVIISFISNILAKTFLTKEIAYVAIALIVILIFLKIPGMQKNLSKKFKGEMKKHFHVKDLLIKDVLLKNEADNIIEVPIHESSPYIGSTFREKIKESDDINILYIKRGDLMLRKERLRETLQAGDKLLLYGDKTAIGEMFSAEIKNLEKKKVNDEETLKSVL
ncbi:MAG: TrkA C-terminal domain-containing protein [Bacillota bacterium]|nr:TrkA C-terminal domain-containing protein [Bacillota bacterium]MDP4169613.1 TrkA C-terminal domain-containing protein [Bacillota bacterium]